MIRYTFSPSWRLREKDDTKIEVVLYPNAEWFESLRPDPHKVVRFALMEDGDLYFGDAYTVVHHDMMQLHGPDRTEPILVGSMVCVEGVWRIGSVQYFMHGENEVEKARRLLCRLDNWQSAIAALGQDPLLSPPWGQEI